MEIAFSEENEIEKLNKIRHEITHYSRELERLRIELKIQEKLVNANCKHTWVLEDIDVGAYEKKYHICSKCQLYRHPYLYR